MSVEVFYSTEFKREYKKLPKKVKDAFKERGRLFAEDPFHPILKTHKLSCALQGLWAFSIDFRHRIIFEFTAKRTVMFHAIGNHEIYRKK